MPGVSLYEKQFNAQRSGGPEWLLDLRRNAMDAFRAQGFPGLRDEEWRFTRIKPIQERDFETAASYRPNGFGAKLAELTFDDTDCHRIVVVNGQYAPDLSRPGNLPPGMTLMSMSEALGSRHAGTVRGHMGSLVDIVTHPFAALNTAFVNDGVFLHLADGVAVDDPIHLIFAATGNSIVTHPRVLVIAGRNTEASLIESWVGTGDGYFTNAVVEIDCGPNSNVTHCRIQHERPDAFHVSGQHIHLARDSRFSTESVSIGAALARNDVTAHLDGEGIDCRLDGLYLAGERQHIDNHTYIRHAKPHCHSFELYKGILADRARGVFNGKIYVDPDAQKTDAKQQNNCILLSDDARINSNPQLEIFADDVKCTHGATVGQLDENAIFYLRSRGIGADEARHILIHAFAGEVLERIHVGDVRERLEVELFWWLSKTVSLHA